MGGHVYIMSSLNHRTLYTGVTSNLPARVAKHEEKRIKAGSRRKKEILINGMNPGWKDLYEETRFR